MRVVTTLTEERQATAASAHPVGASTSQQDNAPPIIPPAGETDTNREQPITNRCLESLQQMMNSIASSTYKQLAAEKEPLLTETDKPYAAWHDQVPFPQGYSKPRFQMFDGTGDAREHLTHFEAACGDIATQPSLLLRQFSLSLKGAAFQWYSRLAPGSVPDWNTMKALFKSHFISVRKSLF